MKRTHSLLRYRARLCGAAAGITLASLLATSAQAQSLADARVTAGTASVAGLGTSNVVVTQSSDKAVIDWRSFSVDKGSSVRFDQPGTHSIALNRVTGTDVSQINGSLTGNGQVWILNPNGVLIGSGGSVSAAGFLATTHAIGNADFLAGNYAFDGTGATGGVVNQGRIVTDGGYAVLAGLRVANTGYVQANLGQVVLGAGKAFALDLNGDKLLSFAVTQPVDIAAVANSGTLAARGGRVVLTARSAADVIGSVVNTTGLIDATAASNQGGEIVLDGGTAGLVYAGGTLDASGKAAGQTGGAIRLFGDTVVVGAGALLDASGDAGGGTINVGGGWQGAIIDGHASAVRAGVAAGALLDASATGTGDGGTISLWSDTSNGASQTLAYGTFLARGGLSGGNGGRIETSGHYLDTAGATGSAAARSTTGKAGLWLLDPYNVEIVAAGTIGAGAPVNYFDTGLAGWQTTYYGTGGANSTINVVNSLTSGGMTYTLPNGGNFAVLTLNSGAGNTSPYVVLSKDFTTAQPISVDLYTLVLGSSSYANASAFVQRYSDYSYVQSDATANGSWQKVTLTVANGQYHVSGNANDSSAASGGGNSQLQLAFTAIGTSGSSPNGSFAASGFGQTWTPTATPSKIDVSQITGFLNAGTNVQVTTTGAGTDAGNITVSAAIAKTAGAAATLRLDATNAIIVNQAIGSTAGALNVTLNAGTGGIQLNNNVGTNGGTLTLNTTGVSTQTAAFTTGTLALSGIGGTHNLTNTGNVFAAVGGNTGLASLNDSVATSVAGLTTTGALSLTSAGAITLSGSDNFGGATTLATPAGITLAGGAQIATAGVLALEAGTNFTNNAGAAAITTIGSGRWLVYSQAPASDVFGGLVSNNTAIWGATPASTPPGSAPAGNRYLFALSPTITLTPTATRKTYGDTLDPATVPIAITGLVNASTYGNVFTQDQVSGTPALDTSYGGFSAASYTGGYTLQSKQGTLVAPAGYVFAFGSAMLTVDPRALILAAVTDSRVYDGTTGSTRTPTATGLVNGDTIANLTQAFDSANAGNRQLAVNTNYAISTNGFVNGMQGRIDGSFNYTITRQTAPGTITPRGLTAALIGTTAKTYDGGLVAALAAGNYQLTGILQGDNVALNNPATGTYADKNVGTGKTVTATGLALTGTAAGNYTVNASASAAIGSITAKTLAASLIGTSAKTYDGTTTAALAAGNYQLAGTFSGDDVSLNNPASGTYADKNVGTGKTVTATGLALMGTDAGNYTVNGSASAAIGAIGAKALAASLTGSTAKTYDGTTTAMLAAGNYQLAGTVSGDDVALNGAATGGYADKNVGTAKSVTATGLALSGGDAGNYTVNGSASGNIGSITAAMLTASLIGATAKTYDGTTTAALVASNYQLAGAVAGDSVALNGPTTGSYADKNAGAAKTVTATGLALSGSDAGNYTVNTSASAAIGSIAAAALTASLTGTTTKAYDGTTTAALANGNYQLAGVVSGDAVTLNDPTSGSYADKNAGTGKTVTATGLALSGADAGNYTVNGSASAAIGSITAAMLTASLTGSTTKIYDGTSAAALGSANYQLAGIVSGDDVALNDPLAGSYADKNAGTGKTVTATGLALSGADAGNYTVNSSTSAAIGSITAAMLTASLTGSSAKTYDGTTTGTLAAGNYQLAGVVAGDSVALNNPVGGRYADKNAGTGKSVTATGLALSGTDAGNYTVNGSATAAIGSIAAKALTASLTGSTTKNYDGTTTAVLAPGNYQLAGAIAGDGVALNNPSNGSYADKNVGTGKSVMATGLALSGTDAGNYTVNAGASAAIGSIAAKALDVALVGDVSRLANGSNAATLTPDNFALTGFVSGESAQVTQTAGQYDGAAAGTSITVTTTLSANDFLAASSTSLSNYILPVGILTGRVGTITPQVIVAIATQPIVPQVTATVTPVSTAAATPSAPVDASPAPAASATVEVAAIGATSVPVTPPSPVAAAKPPTPADSADVGDPILAAASAPTDKPAPQAGRRSTVTTPIAGGLLAEQRALPPHTGQVAGVDDAFSGSGAGL